MSVRNIFKTHPRGFNFGINKTFNMRDKSDSRVNGSYLKQFGVKKWEQFQSYLAMTKSIPAISIKHNKKLIKSIRLHVKTCFGVGKGVEVTYDTFVIT